MPISVLGSIDPARFAGGRMPLDVRRGRGGAGRPMSARRLGLVTRRSRGFGVAEIVDENMANAARVHAVERGKDIADCTA